MTKDKFDRQSFLINKTIDTSTNNLAAKLKGEFQTGDRSNMPRDQWLQVIQQNWQNPQWRADKAKQYGSTQFVRDALDAFGIPQTALQSGTTPLNPDTSGSLNVGTDTATANNATIVP